jgi:plasmid stability protein
MVCPGRASGAFVTGMLALRQQKQHYAAVPKSITVRDVPDETAEELAARAALTGRSLQEYLRARLIELAQAPDAEALMARVRARKAATAHSISPERILEHRDADRR